MKEQHNPPAVTRTGQFPSQQFPAQYIPAQAWYIPQPPPVRTPEQGQQDSPSQQPSGPVAAQPYPPGSSCQQVLLVPQPIMLPHTPRPQLVAGRQIYLSPSQGAEMPPGSANILPYNIPATPKYSIPSYYQSRFNSQDPAVGEMLVGCGMLLMLAIAVLAILYFVLI